MRKVLTFLGASLLLATVVCANAQQAPDMFKDVDTSHWAYQAVESLRAKGILIGYPDTYFRGKRTLTRYEFAVALDRALKTIPKGDTGATGPQGEPGAPGAQGEPGAQGDKGDVGVTPEELATFKRLADEFRNELASLGNSVSSINSKLNKLASELAEVKDTLNKMPKIYGGAWFGLRSDLSRGPFVDYDGRFHGRNNYGSLASRDYANPLRDSAAIYHDFTLGVKANIPGGATLNAELTSNNYKNGLGGSTSWINDLVIDPASDTYLRRLEINAPFAGLGRDGKFTIGRFGQKISHLILWRPEVDTYLNDPFETPGDYTVDGARLATNFGSVSFDVFGAKSSSVTGNNGQPWNMPLAGANSTFGPSVLSGNFKPVGVADVGQIELRQMAGVTLGMGFNSLLQGGRVSFTALDGDNQSSRGGTGSFNNVLVLGANVDLGLTDRLKFNGEWGKSITNTGKFDAVNTHDNNAFNGTLGYKSGGMDVTAGYRYIDPLFYAPGYWGHIGNWINPTNIQGPVVRAAYDFSPTFGVNVGGDFFTGARNRGPSGLDSNDDINRVLVGLRWDVAKNFQTTVDWEGVYWALDGARYESNTKIHPTEHYITLGTGYHLTTNTLIKLSYQIGAYDGHNALNSGVGNRYNFNTISSQVAVKF